MDSNSKKQVFTLGDNKLGVGDVKFCWQPGCKWLAVIGETRVVVIVDRLGKTIVEFQIKSGGKVKQMEFDNEGDTLALFQENSDSVTIINVHSKKVFEMPIERNNKDKPSYICWGKKESYLAICTELGLIYIYNKTTSKIIPCTLCHSSSIITCDWNDDGLLVTGSTDRTLSIIEKNGKSISSGTKVREIPKMIKWAKTNLQEKGEICTTISTVLADKVILIYDTSKKKGSLELNLKEEHGNIVTYEWFGDGYIAVGFSKGVVSILSTHSTEMKSEVTNFKPFKTGIDDIAICEDVNRIAVAGENMVKIYDSVSYEELKDEQIEVPFQAGRISKIAWSVSGQILVVSTLTGNIFAFNVVVNEAYAIKSKI